MSVDEWAAMECENAVRVNGCEDESPYYDVPWAEGPGFALFTERWCEACVKEDPYLEIDGDDVVWDLSDNDNTELDEVRGSEIVEAEGAIVSEDQLL